MAKRQKNRPFNSTNVRIRSVGRHVTRIIISAMWRCAPGYTEQRVKKVFFSPVRPPLIGTQRKILSQGKEYEWRLNDKAIRYWRWGQGPAILLAHGWNGRGISLFRFIEPLVEAGYTVIAFDAPGHGESDGTTTSYFEFTDVVRTFIKPERRLNFVGVIGHSFGAAATVNALSKEQLPVPAVLIAPALKLKEVLYSTFDGYGIPENLCRNIIAKYERIYGYNLDRDNPVRLLPTLTGPMLVIHDPGDEVIPYGDSRMAAENNTSIRFHTTTGLGHKRILLDEEVVRMTLAYLKEHDQARHPETNPSDSQMVDTEMVDTQMPMAIIEKGGRHHEKSIPHR